MRQKWQRRSGVVGWAVAIAVVLVVARPVESATVVVPNTQATTEGNTNNIFPFDCATSVLSQRYQQVYLSSEVGSGTITQVAFRQDGELGGAFGPATIHGITITLSSTSAAPDGLSATFANNIGADVTTVFSGNLTLSSAASAAVPRPFDIVIPLQTPFPFNAASGLNLLLDVTIPTCVVTKLFDGQFTIPDSVSRTFTAASGSGSLNSDSADTFWLVTQFTITQAIPTLSEWAMIGMVLILAGIAVWRLRRRPVFST